MPAPEGYHLDTLALHAGQAVDPATGARAVPIYQSTSFAFASAEHAAELFNLDETGNIYTRIGNPTNDVLEKRVAALEGGVAAVAVASGQSATLLAVLTLAKAGDEIVSAVNLYGGTYNLFRYRLPELGITVRFVPPNDMAALEAAINDRTRAVFAETIGNPSLDVLDIAATAAVAHRHGVPLIVDNTFATPALCRPIEHGADVVVHSLTKWLGGHGTSIGGIVVDAGRFPWADSGRFPLLTEPDPSYHGIRYVEDFGTLAYITKLRVQGLRDYGPALSPTNAFLILLGIETLPLRMRRHSENALRVASALVGHPGVRWVRHPALPGDPSHALARRYLPDGAGGMVVFGLEGGLAAGRRLIQEVALFSHVANVGDARSLIIHPATTTHMQMTAEERQAAGVGDDLIRLSVGLEHPDDLVRDLVGAVARATGKGDPSPPPLNDEGVIARVAGRATVDGRPIRVAVVGLSANPARPSYRVARKLKRLGYAIVPVNPKGGEILGERVVPSLAALPEPVDVVQVFRDREGARMAAEELRPGQARVFWLQEGVVAPEAAALAAAKGFAVVMNRCLFKEAQRLRGAYATYVASDPGRA